MFNPRTIDVTKVQFGEIQTPGVRQLDRLIIDIDNIYQAPLKDNPTRSKGKNKEHIENLKSSLMLGIDYSKMPPVVIKSAHNENGHITEYELIAGYHRMEAMRTLNLECWVFDVYEIPDTNSDVGFEDAIRTFQLFENNHTPSLGTSKDDAVSTVNRLLLNKSSLIDPTAQSILDYLNNYCSYMHYQTKCKVVREVTRALQKNGIVVYNDILTYTSTDVKDFLDKKTDLVSEGNYDMLRDEYGWSVLEGYEYEFLVNSARKFAETQKKSYLSLHTKPPTEKYSVYDRRTNMSKKFNYLENCLLKCFEYYQEKGEFPWYIKGFLPQVVSDGEKEYIDAK
jgi:hypothetical protein